MFLDPDPKGREKTTRVASPSSPFFASQSPIPSPREQSWRIKRTPPLETSPTFKKQTQRRSTSTGEDAKSTVRLVGQSPEEPAQKGSDSDYYLSGKQDWTAVNHAQPHTSLLASSQPTSGSETGSPAASRVSDGQSVIPRAQKLDLPPIVTLMPSTYFKPGPEPSRNRRSTSSKYSVSTASHDTDAFEFSFSDGSRSRSRLSRRSTLNEEDIPDVGEEKEVLNTKPPALETVRETSPERSTAPSVSSSNYKGRSSDTTRELQSSPPGESPSNSSSHPAPLWTSRTPYTPQDSLTSLQASSLSLPHTLVGQDSQDSLAYDRRDSPQTSSSPNFIAFSDSTSPHSPESPLHNAGSLDSIQARLGTPSAFRPAAELDNTPTQSSPRLSSPQHHYRSLSADSVSPLHSPVRFQQEDQNTRPNSMNMADNIDFEEIDLEPWPRPRFSSHLSTIASMSDRAMSPAQFSHFSMGSGVLTIDDAYSIPMSSTRSRGSGNLSSLSMYRRGSEPLQSPTRKSSSPAEAQRSDEEPGDMTLGVYRAESAKPEPLFVGRQVTSAGDVRYDGPLPPLPPMPRSRAGNSDENSDRLSALSAPSLKKKRSGYSVRGRSNSTPSGNSRANSIISYCDSDRWSKGSTIFPIWAKNFYGGYAALLSASKISLSNPPTPKRELSTNQPGHTRSMSAWTQHSITSRLGTGYSEIDNVSPTSSHFLPSIFRPRTRTLGAADAADSRSFKFGSKTPKRKASQPQADEISRSDSMAITSAPSGLGDESGETLPSGHPKFGTLKDESSNQAPPMPPLPRKYSKQKLWDEMSFPRPMTKDRLSDFKLDVEEDPHLVPNKRQESQINKWRSPSFVESFDTLFNSRGNRQILLFALGFLFPFFWLLGALLPLPPRRSRDANEAEKALPNADSEDDLTAALNKHRSGDAKLKWDEERLYLKAKWWRTLNRVMCVVGMGIIAAVVSLILLLYDRTSY